MYIHTFILKIEHIAGKEYFTPDRVLLTRHRNSVKRNVVQYSIYVMPDGLKT
jgi:hypothetical protein